jgi:hypothetical protein
MPIIGIMVTKKTLKFKLILAEIVVFGLTVVVVVFIAVVVGFVIVDEESSVNVEFN